MGLTMGDIFDTNEPGGARLNRRSANPGVSIGSMTKRRLTPGSAARLEVIAAHFDAHGSTGDVPYVHGDSDELCVVVSGRVRVEVNDQRFELEVGDSLYYRSSTPHAFHAIGEEEAEVLWIIAPPSY